MSDLVSDTHSAIWYFSDVAKLSAAASTAFEDALEQGKIILLPTISIVEIIYLTEKNRLPRETLSTLIYNLKSTSSSFISQDLTSEIAKTLAQIPRATVPDMPDRIIAATALHLNIPLITRDRNIRKLQSIRTIW